MAYQALVGQFLGQYELRELLGVGGMGASIVPYHIYLFANKSRNGTANNVTKGEKENDQ